MTIKIGGEAGFGIMTTGLVLGKIATRSGYHAFEYSEYPSLIRGSHNVIEVRISDMEVLSQEKKVDILLCLNFETLQLHIDEMKEGGLVVLDETKADFSKIDKKKYPVKFINIPFSKILSEGKMPTVMVNTIAMGSLMHLVGADFEIIKEMTRENFARKGQEIIDKNIEAAQKGFDHAKNALKEGYKVKIPRKEKIESRLFITGNEIIGLGAIAAKCKFYVAYPMTPASALLHYLAANAPKSGMVVKHAEDEISVINMALGSSWAGVRSMVGTSGGGYALMVESIALAGITETPVVVMMGQRPGPATGMPTWTEQGDLLFIIRSGHGEFPKIVLAPGDVEEAYKLTIEAFNLADIYQTPVFIMTDKYLLEGHRSIDENIIKNFKYVVDRGKLLDQKSLSKIQKYLRYQLTDDGISPRAVPGMKGSLHQANSYEHSEDGHTSESAKDRLDQVDKRDRKAATFLKKNYKLPQLYGPKDASLTIVSWGSMKQPILQAMKDSGGFNYIHFNYLWPQDEKKLTEFLSSFKNLLLVENNSTAQLGQIIRMVTGIKIENRMLRYDGRPVYPQDLISKIKEQKRK